MHHAICELQLNFVVECGSERECTMHFVNCSSILSFDADQKGNAPCNL